MVLDALYRLYPRLIGQGLINIASVEAALRKPSSEPTST